jgi:hypothetical protein
MVMVIEFTSGGTIVVLSDVAVMTTVNSVGAVLGAVYVAAVTLVTLKVPGFAGIPVPTAKAQLTPAPVVSLGTVAVMVIICPAVILVAEARRMTELKSEGMPEQLVQLLL